MSTQWYDEAQLLHKYIANQLSSLYETKEAQNISRVLLQDLFDIRQTDLLLNAKISFNQDQLNTLHSSIDRLKKSEPVQYITGKCFFHGHEFKVNKDVLIPRPETEELVNLVIENAQTGINILDIGTGSGCIAISLGKKLDQVKITALDIDNKALEVAEFNSNQLGVDILFKCTDILSLDDLDEKFDIIVSNPPYVFESDAKQMEANVKHFEPSKALFVPDDNPLIFYEKIATLGLNGLSQNGLLFFEIHEKMGERIQSMLEKMGYRDVFIKWDMQGKDRMAMARVK